MMPSSPAVTIVWFRGPHTARVMRPWCFPWIVRISSFSSPASGSPVRRMRTAEDSRMNVSVVSSRSCSPIESSTERQGMK